MAGKNPVFQKIVGRELEEGVRGSSTDPLAAVKSPPKKSGKKKKANAQNAKEQELLETAKRNHATLAAIEQTFKKEALLKHKSDLVAEREKRSAALCSVFETKAEESAGKLSRKRAKEYMAKFAKKSVLGDGVELT